MGISSETVTRYAILATGVFDVLSFIVLFTGAFCIVAALIYGVVSNAGFLIGFGSAIAAAVYTMVTWIGLTVASIISNYIASRAARSVEPD